MKPQDVVELIRRVARAAGYIIGEVEIVNQSYNGDDDKPWHIKMDGLYLYPCDVEVPTIVGKTKVWGWAVDAIKVWNNYPHAPDDHEDYQVVEPMRFSITPETRRLQREGKQPPMHPTTIHEAVRAMILVMIGFQIDNQMSWEID